MKHFLSAIGLVFFLPAYGFAQTPAELYPTDETIATNAPWKPGDVVYEYEIPLSDTLRYTIYRRFLGLTESNHFLVQEFYEPSDTKFTDPYILLAPSFVIDRLANLNACLFEHPALSGTYVSWYINGEKMMRCTYRDRQMHGQMTLWSDNGQKIIEGSYDHGQQTGIWYAWDAKGNLLEEHDYGSPSVILFKAARCSTLRAKNLTPTSPTGKTTEIEPRFLTNANLEKLE